jgi:hypothetical protein
VLDPIAVEIRRHPHLGPQHGSGAGVRPRNGESVPSRGSPGPVIAKPNRHERQTQLAGKIDRALRHPPPRPPRAVWRDRQIHGFTFAQQLSQSGSAAAIRRAANQVKSEQLGGLEKYISITVLADQHRQIAVPAQKKRKQNVFVPEYIDSLGFIAGSRVNRAVVKGRAIVKRAHPQPDSRRTEQSCTPIQRGLIEKLLAHQASLPY